jgi:hypothetical protein
MILRSRVGVTSRRRSLLHGGRFVGAGALAIALGLVAVWLLRGTTDVPRSGPALADPASPDGSASALVRVPIAPLEPPGGAARSTTPGPAADGGAKPAPRPAEGIDAPSWRNARFAFTFRELGKMGPYVKAGLDGARREMSFCFDEAKARSGQDAHQRSGQPAVLLLYLEAREGALDIVDTRTERMGEATVELVECCRQVLRGFTIPAFDTVPGQRFRVRFELE